MRIIAAPLGLLAFATSCASTADRFTSPNPYLTVEPVGEPEPDLEAGLVPALAPDLAPPPAAAAPTAAARAARAPIDPAAPTAVFELARNTIAVKYPGATEDDRVGVIRKGTRVAVRRSEIADGCDGAWLELVPRGWICDAVAVPTQEPATTAVAHTLTDAPDPDDRVVPGLYGTVRGKNAIAFDSASDARTGANGRALVGTNSVRATSIVTVDGRRYWRTSGGDLIESSAIRRFSPSRFHGVALAADAPLPAWVRGHRDPKEPVVTRESPAARGRVVRELEARTVVTATGMSDDGRFVRIGDAEWIARDDLRIATRTARPDGLAADEKWLDVDLDEQVLVAYEGDLPVYATLVSTGKSGHRTPARITRVKAKLERATMANADGEVYSVADVPWTMYYADPGFALHTSYWHNGFGGPRSHGCINLAPHDARVLYHWSSPDVPPGWTAVYGDEENPGSLVRVRSHRVPEPEYRGYARKMIASR